jgi:hypothetical protein
VPAGEVIVLRERKVAIHLPNGEQRAGCDDGPTGSGADEDLLDRVRRLALWKRRPVRPRLACDWSHRRLKVGEVPKEPSPDAEESAVRNGFLSVDGHEHSGRAALVSDPQSAVAQRHARMMGGDERILWKEDVSPISANPAPGGGDAILLPLAISRDHREGQSAP